MQQAPVSNKEEAALNLKSYVTHGNQTHFTFTVGLAIT